MSPKRSHSPLSIATFVIAAGAATVIALGGCGGSSDDSSDTTAASSTPATSTADTTATDTTAAAPASGGDAVKIVDFSFGPATLSVAKGTTVDFTNGGQAPHTATADDKSFDTGTLNPGQSGKVTLDTAGKFPYVCTIHPFMHGEIDVE
jgi:plastocyanin